MGGSAAGVLAGEGVPALSGIGIAYLAAVAVGRRLAPSARFIRAARQGTRQQGDNNQQGESHLSAPFDRLGFTGLQQK